MKNNEIREEIKAANLRFLASCREIWSERR